MTRNWICATSLLLALVAISCGSPQPAPAETTDESPVEAAAPAHQDETAAQDMRGCESAEDCVPVGCSCSCSGCGGFDHDDVVNAAFEQQWYEQQGCTKPEVCPTKCCPKMTLTCEGGQCVVKAQGESLGESLDSSAVTE
jgi:hypothetical protein